MIHWAYIPAPRQGLPSTSLCWRMRDTPYSPLKSISMLRGLQVCLLRTWFFPFGSLTGWFFSNGCWNCHPDLWAPTAPSPDVLCSIPTTAPPLHSQTPCSISPHNLDLYTAPLLSQPKNQRTPGYHSHQPWVPPHSHHPQTRPSSERNSVDKEVGTEPKGVCMRERCPQAGQGENESNVESWGEAQQWNTGSWQGLRKPLRDCSSCFV